MASLMKKIENNNYTINLVRDAISNSLSLKLLSVTKNNDL